MIRPLPEKPFKIMLAGAHQARHEDPDFIGIDEVKTDAVDYTMRLQEYPWPIESDVVDTIFAAFYYHRLPQDERIAFVNECYRVLKPRGQLIMVNPYYTSMRAIMDPRAKWPPISEGSFAFFSEAERKAQNIDCGIVCDFECGYGPSFHEDFAGRNDEYLRMAMMRLNNSVNDLLVTLTKRSRRPPE